MADATIVRGPWHDQAEFIREAAKDAITDGERTRARRMIEQQLQWAYEMGHAQGRLEELEKAAAAAEAIEKEADSD